MKNKNEQDLSLLLDEEIQGLLKSHLYSKKPLFGKDSPFSVLLQSMVNRILDAEIDSFLSEEHQSGKKNKRNGRMEKQVRSSVGPLTVSTPRDRNAEFEPQLVGKRQRELSSGLDEQIIALYAQGNSVEDVRRLLQKMYGVEIDPAGPPRALRRPHQGSGDRDALMALRLALGVPLHFMRARPIPAYVSAQGKNI